MLGGAFCAFVRGPVCVCVCLYVRICDLLVCVLICFVLWVLVLFGWGFVCFFCVQYFVFVV